MSDDDWEVVPDLPDTLSVGEIEQLVGVSPETLRRWRHDPRLGFPKIVHREGNKAYFYEHEVREWLEHRNDVIEDSLTTLEVCDWLHVTIPQLGNLRHQGFPDPFKRGGGQAVSLYHKTKILEWVKNSGLATGLEQIQVAYYIGCSVATVQRWRYDKTSEFPEPRWKFSNKPLWAQEDVDSWLEATNRDRSGHFVEPKWAWVLREDENDGKWVEQEPVFIPIGGSGDRGEELEDLGDVVLSRNYPLPGGGSKLDVSWGPQEDDSREADDWYG